MQIGLQMHDLCCIIIKKLQMLSFTLFTLHIVLDEFKNKRLQVSYHCYKKLKYIHKHNPDHGMSALLKSFAAGLALGTTLIVRLFL